MIGVTLPETSFALEPPPGCPIEHDRRLTLEVEGIDPPAPRAREAFRSEDLINHAPTDGVEGFSEVKLKHQRQCFSFVAALNKHCGIDEVLRYTPPF